MARNKFPSNEGNVLVLANEMKTGLENNTTVYPAPPVDPTSMQGLIVACQNAQNAVIEARAISENATAIKIAAFEALTAAMKNDIRYAENKVNFDDAKLKLIGWSGRKTPEALTEPGQVLELIAVKQGEGWVELSWKKPVDGGAVSSYNVYRRQRPEGSWELVKSAFYTSITLTSQTRGIEWEYCICAANKAGEGMLSNTVLAVL